MFKHLIDQIILSIDSGKLLKKPVKWLYFLFSLIFFIPVLVSIYLLIDNWDEISDILTFDLGENVWGTFVGVLMIFIFIYALAIIGICIFHYWNNKAKAIDRKIKDSSTTFAIPLIADLNQCLGESTSLLLVLSTICGGILFFVTLLLTGGGEFYHEANCLVYLLWTILAIAGAAILAYINILLAHFFSEKMRLSPIISNDLRDLKNGIKDSKEEEKETAADTDSTTMMTKSDWNNYLLTIATFIYLSCALGAAIVMAIDMNA